VTREQVYGRRAVREALSRQRLNKEIAPRASLLISG